MPAILVLGRPRKEDHEFEASLDYIARACLKKKRRKEEHQWLESVILDTWAVEIERIKV
jgi:hypothetical protein